MGVIRAWETRREFRVWAEVALTGTVDGCRGREAWSWVKGGAVGATEPVPGREKEEKD